MRVQGNAMWHEFQYPVSSISSAMLHGYFRNLCLVANLSLQHHELLHAALSHLSNIFVADLATNGTQVTSDIDQCCSAKCRKRSKSSAPPP